MIVTPECASAHIRGRYKSKRLLRSRIRRRRRSGMTSSKDCVETDPNFRRAASAVQDGMAKRSMPRSISRSIDTGVTVIVARNAPRRIRWIATASDFAQAALKARRPVLCFLKKWPVQAAGMSQSRHVLGLLQRPKFIFYRYKSKAYPFGTSPAEKSSRFATWSAYARYVSRVETG